MPAKNVPTPSQLPERKTALAELSRRDVRAWVSCGVRIVALALLSTMLRKQFPALEPYRVALDAVACVLILYPLLTMLGKNAAWRVALGRSYAKVGHWEDAIATLAPLRKARARLLDATGEGTYWLAVSLQEVGQTDEARVLFEHVASNPRQSEWVARAQEALA